MINLSPQEIWDSIKILSKDEALSLFDQPEFLSYFSSLKDEYEKQRKQGSSLSFEHEETNSESDFIDMYGPHLHEEGMYEIYRQREQEELFSDLHEHYYPAPKYFILDICDSHFILGDIPQHLKFLKKHIENQPDLEKINILEACNRTFSRGYSFILDTSSLHSYVYFKPSNGRNDGVSLNLKKDQGVYWVNNIAFFDKDWIFKNYPKYYYDEIGERQFGAKEEDFTRALEKGYSWEPEEITYEDM